MKKLYISPGAVRIPAREIPTLMAGSPREQSPDCDAKENNFDFEDEVDANPWNLDEQKHNNLWD